MLEDSEEIKEEMEAMEGNITSHIITLGEQITQEIRKTADDQMKDMKEELSQMREELREIRQNLKKVIELCCDKALKNGETSDKREGGEDRQPPGEVVSSESSEPLEAEDVKKDALDGPQATPSVREEMRGESVNPMEEETVKQEEKKKDKTDILNKENACVGAEGESTKKPFGMPLTYSSAENSQPSLAWFAELKIMPVHLTVGEVPLISSVVSGEIGKVRSLLQLGANIRMRDAWGFNALHHAAVCGFTDIAKLLLEVSKELVATRALSKNYCTPLHLAAEIGYSEVAEVLIEAGANISAKDANGLTALHVASKYGQTDLVNLLLSKRADIMHTDNAGQSPLHLGAKGGHIDIVNCLLDKGADVRGVNLNQQTALHLAAMEGHLSVVQVLLHRGSEIGKVDNKKYSPLHYAAANNHVDVVQFLLTKNADVTLCTEQKETPLCCAAKNGCDKTVNVLVDKSIDLSLDGQNALTALDMAAKEGHMWVVSSLLKASSGITGEAGNKAVLTAVQNNLVHALKTLILEGANPHLVAPNGQFAIQIAAEESPECKKILENAGACMPLQTAAPAFPPPPSSVNQANLFTSADSCTTMSVFGGATSNSVFGGATSNSVFGDATSNSVFGDATSNSVLRRRGRGSEPWFGVFK